MGANSRRRRAARNRTGHARTAPPDANPFDGGKDQEALSPYAIVEMVVWGTIGNLGTRKVPDGEARTITEGLRDVIHRRWPPGLLGEVLARVVEEQTREVMAHGWGPADLRQLVGRCAGSSPLRLIENVLDDEALPRWDSTEVQAAALRAVAVLCRAPRVAASDLVGQAPSDEGEHPMLAKVRALLAKAESTEYDEEADALSAKAQELISKHALERLVDRDREGRPGDLAVRRLWLDPPYVRVKATLVHEVALANRARSACAEAFGFCLLVGAPADLDAVELLVTSLLVQADSAMLRHGRRIDGRGRSRTRSFRRAFLLGYAGRIGQRFRAVDEGVVAESGDRLPVLLRDHEERVSTAFSQALPSTEERVTTTDNREGWAAGVVAADLAQLDVRGRLSERAE